jgi:hypothetical protein
MSLYTLQGPRGDKNFHDYTKNDSIMSRMTGRFMPILSRFCHFFSSLPPLSGKKPEKMSERGNIRAGGIKNEEPGKHW